MTFQDLLVTLRDDEFGQLRSEKALQPSDAAQFVNLLGDPRLQIAVQLPNLLGALAQLAKQPSCAGRAPLWLKMVAAQAGLSEP